MERRRREYDLRELRSAIKKQLAEQKTEGLEVYIRGLAILAKAHLFEDYIVRVSYYLREKEGILELAYVNIRHEPSAPRRDPLMALGCFLTDKFRTLDPSRPTFAKDFVERVIDFQSRFREALPILIRR